MVGDGRREMRDAAWQKEDEEEKGARQQMEGARVEHGAEPQQEGAIKELCRLGVEEQEEGVIATRMELDELLYYLVEDVESHLVASCVLLEACSVLETVCHGLHG